MSNGCSVPLSARTWREGFCADACSAIGARGLNGCEHPPLRLQWGFLAVRTAGTSFWEVCPALPRRVSSPDAPAALNVQLYRSCDPPPSGTRKGPPQPAGRPDTRGSASAAWRLRGSSAGTGRTQASSHRLVHSGGILQGCLSVQPLFCGYSLSPAVPPLRAHRLPWNRHGDFLFRGPLLTRPLQRVLPHGAHPAQSHPVHTHVPHAGRAPTPQASILEPSAFSQAVPPPGACSPLDGPTA